MDIICPVGALGADSQASGLCISKSRTGTDLKVLLLPGAPCLHIAGLHLQISQIAAAALQSTHGNIQAAEKIYSVCPHLIIPFHGILRLAEHYHLLLLELMYAVHSPLLDSMGTYFLSEAGRIRCHCNRKIALLHQLTLKLSYHRMLGGPYQVQILALNLVHHGFHFCKAHDSIHHIAANHKRGNTIGKSLIDHKITGIAYHCGMNSRGFTHEIIEAVSAGTPCGILVQTTDTLYNIRVVGHLKIRLYRLSVFFYFYIFTVIPTDGNGRVDYIGNHHHNFCDPFLKLRFYRLQLCKPFGACRNLRLLCFRFFPFSLCH